MSGRIQLSRRGAEFKARPGLSRAARASPAVLALIRNIISPPSDNRHFLRRKKPRGSNAKASGERSAAKPGPGKRREGEGGSGWAVGLRGDGLGS